MELSFIYTPIKFTKHKNGNFSYYYHVSNAETELSFIPAYSTRKYQMQEWYNGFGRHCTKSPN